MDPTAPPATHPPSEEFLAEQARLRAALEAALAEIEQHREEKRRREAEIQALQMLNERLARRIESLGLRLRKNERFTIDSRQLLLFLSSEAEGGDEAEEEEAPPSPPASPPERRKRGENIQRHAHGRSTLPAHLPRRTLRCAHDTTVSCPTCQGPLQVIGTDTSERLEWVPGHFEVVEVETEKAACPHCPQEGVQSAEQPFALPRARCGNGLLAKVLVDKFADHIPLHRQARRFARLGVRLSESTLCGWVQQGAGLLKVVVEVMLEEIRNGSFAQADDTGLPIQDGQDGQLRQARLWVYSNGEHAVFRVSRTKEKEGPAEHLKGFQGRLLLDGGSEFNLIGKTEGVERAGCWSHARRYFFDARSTDPIDAGEALIQIREFFLLERTVREASPLERYRVRQEQLKPKLAAFREWARDRERDIRPSSALGEAFTYLRNQWPRLTLFLDHPDLPMHNNAAEFQLRQPVVGRKNWLFAGSEGGAESAAVLFSLMGSCILQAIDPWLYLNDVLIRLPAWPRNRVHELTPAAWRAARLREMGGAT